MNEWEWMNECTLLMAGLWFLTEIMITLKFSTRYARIILCCVIITHNQWNQWTFHHLSHSQLLPECFRIASHPGWGCGQTRVASGNTGADCHWLINGVSSLFRRKHTLLMLLVFDTRIAIVVMKIFFLNFSFWCLPSDASPLQSWHHYLPLIAHWDGR